MPAPFRAALTAVSWAVRCMAAPLDPVRGARRRDAGSNRHQHRDHGLSGDLALVHEQRTLRLASPETRFAFNRRQRKLRPETVSWRDPQRASEGRGREAAGPDLRVPCHTPQSLLEQSVGQEVSVVTTNPATAATSTERAKVVSAQDGVVLDIGGKLETGAPAG